MDKRRTQEVEVMPDRTKLMRKAFNFAIRMKEKESWTDEDLRKYANVIIGIANGD